MLSFTVKWSKKFIAWKPKDINISPVQMLLGIEQSGMT